MAFKMRNFSSNRITYSNITEFIPGVWRVAANQTGFVYIPLSSPNLEVDGVSYDWYDVLINRVLGDDFGVGGVNQFGTSGHGVPLVATAENPVDQDDYVFYYNAIHPNLDSIEWDLTPANLDEVNSPFSGSGVISPQNPTVWNGFVAVMQQWFLRIRITANSGGSFSFTFHPEATSWYIGGGTDSFPPPPNPYFVTDNVLTLSTDTELQVMLDASGIYTIVPSQYYDDLYQRDTTTSHEVLAVKIPDPFVKTAYFGE